MSLKDTLTNEQLNARFENPFALVNYAISLATIKVKRGEGVESNPANEVLDLIADGQDHIIHEGEEEEEAMEEEKEGIAKGET